jgi:hypothetical protein
MSAASHRLNHSHSPLPSVARAFLGYALALLVGAFCAVQSVALVNDHVGTLAALPLGFFTFIVAAAVALVLAARLDVVLSRQ